jgi:hypothetical protein
VCLERIQPVANSVANCKAEFPKDFEHDILLEAVSRRQTPPRSKLLVETIMKMAFIIKADV